MNTPISTIRNLGPAMEAAFANAGVPDAETLRRLGAHEAYRKLLETGTQPHFIGYYVLHMALQGRPWNDCKGDEKTALRRAFDQLKAEVRTSDAHADSAFEATLDALGVVPKR